MRPLPMLAVLALLAAGCASPNVNPPQARANTGYVDFHSPSADELNWDVARWDERTRNFQCVFSELEPPLGEVLRLAFAPGHYRLRVTFLNRIITQPAEVEVEVLEGRITPVGVTLTEGGVAVVKTKEESRGGTAYGRYGRRTKFKSGESPMYGISAVAEPPVAYEPRERMPYAR